MDYQLNHIDLPDSMGKHRLAYEIWQSEDWQNNAASKNIICVHGLTRNGQDFHQLAKSLLQISNTRIIIPDMAGRHRSEYLKASTDYANGQYGKDIFALLENLAIKEVDWIGTSMGGLIAMQACFEYTYLPVKIKHLVLNDIGCFLPKEALTRIAGYASIAWHFEDRQAASEHIHQAYGAYAFRSSEDWDAFIDHSIEKNPKGGYRRNYDIKIADIFKAVSFDDIDLFPFWHRLSLPILLIRGAESDLLSSITAQRMIVEKQGAPCHLLEIAKSGHAPPLDVSRGN